MTAAEAAEAGTTTSEDEDKKLHSDSLSLSLLHYVSKAMHAVPKFASGVTLVVLRYITYTLLSLMLVFCIFNYFLPRFRIKQPQTVADEVVTAAFTQPANWTAPDTIPYLTFSQLGVKHYIFLGLWNQRMYQASLWVRYACKANGDRAVRVVLTLNEAPYLHVSTSESHGVLPPQLAARGVLPQISFRALANTTSPAYVAVDMQAWDHLLTHGWQTAAFVGQATLPAKKSYTLDMEGSQRTYPVRVGHCTQPHAMFTEHSVWLVTHEKQMDRPDGVLEFLHLQHMYHHLKLGFDGVILIVRPETLDRVKQVKEVVDAVNRKQLVLVAWEYGVVPHIAAYMQVPGYNILRLATNGAKDVVLAMWDVDEYLVLPKHKSVKEELHSGCLQQVLKDEAEAVIPISWAGTAPAKVRARDNSKKYWQHREYPDWIKHGGVGPALRKMKYIVHDTANCKYGIYCKAMINPDAPFNFHVHQFTRPGPAEEALHRTPVPHSCAYVLHFFQLWKWREVWDMNNTRPAAQLRIQDLPRI